MDKYVCDSQSSSRRAWKNVKEGKGETWIGGLNATEDTVAREDLSHEATCA